MPKYTVDTWEDHFLPFTNHIDPHASWQSDGDGTGIMFETFGKELAFVQSQPVEQVWTYIDHSGNGTSIVAGLHIANRIGYFVTAVPRSSGEEDLVIEVTPVEDENSDSYYL